MVGTIGAYAVPHIAEVISRRLRDGDIEMEPRVREKDGPLIAIVRGRARAGLAA